MMEEWRVLFQKSLDLKKENADKTQALLVERDLVEYDSMIGEWEYTGDILNPGDGFLRVFSLNKFRSDDLKKNARDSRLGPCSPRAVDHFNQAKQMSSSNRSCWQEVLRKGRDANYKIEQIN